MNIKVKRFGHHDLPLPTYGTDGAACFDLRVASINHLRNKSVSDENGTLDYDMVQYGCGFGFQIPENHVMLVSLRSSVGCVKGAIMPNAPGVIDSDYRGEVMLTLLFPPTTEEGPRWFPSIGERIAQALVIPVNQFKLEEVEELDPTERGSGGHGSTGTH